LSPTFLNGAPAHEIDGPLPGRDLGHEVSEDDRYLGVAFKPGMGQDNSEATMCAWRCFDAVDTMNNMYAALGLAPKLVIADIDT
jgi:hypothetical protein